MSSPSNPAVKGVEATFDRPRIGFTGTQVGMTFDQKITLVSILRRLKPSEFHHGDCIGSDEEAHELVRTLNNSWGLRCLIVIHPPDDDSKRALCAGDETREPKPYLERNHDIVADVDLLIATPKSDAEQLRSGTWATVRHARKQSRMTCIILPNGDVR